MPSPYEIYEEALKERKNSDPLKRRQACEKGFLAMAEAVDGYLALKGRSIAGWKGTADAHTKRREELDDLANEDLDAREISNAYSAIADKLHGGCFYAGKDLPFYDKVLKEDIAKIFQLTGVKIKQKGMQAASAPLAR